MANPRRVGLLAGLVALFSGLIRISTPERTVASGSIKRRSGGRKVAVGVFTVVATLIATMGVAFADAADPNPDAAGTATIVSGTVTQNPDGSWTVTSGSVNVEVGGTWTWFSRGDKCGARYGVGWAVDWHGISTAPSVPGSVGSLQINGTSNYFHLFETDMSAQPSAGPEFDGNIYPLEDPCQQLTPDGDATGPWGALHTYNSGTIIPELLCVNMYDLHGSPGEPKLGDFDPTSNGDNSIETNDFNPGEGEGNCFEPVFTNNSQIETSATPTAQLGASISDSATLSGVSATAGGAITFKAYLGNCTPANLGFTSAAVSVSGPGAYGPVSFTPTTAGTYNWIASYTGDAVNSPATGECGDEGEVSVITEAPTQNLVGHIYDCTDGPTTTEVPNGTLSAAGPSSIATQANPLDASVNAGQYLVSAGAPEGFHFVNCGSGATLIGNPPLNATMGVTVPSAGTGTAIFYVEEDEIILPPLQFIVGHIYDCTSGPTTTEVSGGTLSAAGPTTVATQPNPLGLGPVSAGQYLMSAGAPPGYHFVNCGSGATLIGNPPVNATIGVNVPTSGTGTGIFYVVPDEPEPVQTLVGHIYDCTDGATTTEVPNGTLSAAGPSTVASQANPLDVTNIASGQYLVSAGAPSGFMFVDCDSEATLIGDPPLNATKSTTVPTNGTGTAVFYVVEIPPPALSVTVDKTNDANGDGTFSDDETGASGDDVTFRATITNNSAVAVVIKTLSDEWAGTPAFTPECEADVVGVVLAANGGSVTCDFTVADYVPPAADGAKVNTVTVGVCEETDPDNCDDGDDTTTVRGGNVLSVTVDKTNDANGDGTFGDDETGTATNDVKFRATIFNNSAVPVTIASISDVWPGISAIAPVCAVQVVGVTLAANGGSVTCDFAVTGYVPPALGGPKVNTLTVVVCEDTHPENCTTDDDTSTVRGVEVLPNVITPPVQTLPRTGATTNGLFVAGIGLLLLGSLLLGVGGRMSDVAFNLRLPATTALVRYPSPPVIDRNLAQGDAIRTSGAWSATSAWRWRRYGGR